MPALSGNVKDSANANVSKLVRVYRRDSGKLVGAVLSDPSTGNWSITTADTSEHFAVFHDAVGNPNWDAIVLAMHFNGTNGSTTFTDEKGHSTSVVGGAQLATGISGMVGSACGAFNGTNAVVVVTDAADLRPRSGDFTVRFRQKYSSLSGVQTLFAKGYGVAGGLVIQTGNGDGKINVYQGAPPTLVVSESGAALSAGTVYDVEISRSGSTMTIYRNNTSVGSATDTTDYSSTADIWIGGGSATGLNNFFFNGYVDELVMYCGLAIHESSFSTEFSNAVSGGTENLLALDRLIPV